MKGENKTMKRRLKRKHDKRETEIIEERNKSKKK